jgi:hypothetical protein
MKKLENNPENEIMESEDIYLEILQKENLDFK